MIESVQSVLNHAPLKRLGLREKKKIGVYCTPLEVFTGQLPKRPLCRADPPPNHLNITTESELLMRRLINIDKTQDALLDLNRDVKDRSDGNRKGMTQRHNGTTNIQPINFTKGDFVLLRKCGKAGHKRSFKWVGPRWVTKCKSELVYEVENICTGAIEVAHARRLRLYGADMDGKEIRPELLRAAEHTESMYQDENSLTDIRDTTGDLEIEIEWEGLPDEIDRTWDPFHQVFEDLPTLLSNFLRTGGKRNLKEKAKALCLASNE